MRLLKKAFLPLLVVGFFIYSCSDKVEVNKMKKTRIRLSRTQLVPAKSDSGGGFMDIEYNKDTRTFYYKIAWDSLSGNSKDFHIHGSAQRGFTATTIIQGFSKFSNNTKGTYSGSIFIDGVVLKETELLNGLYYIDIHSTDNPTAEIRGQIEF